MTSEPSSSDRPAALNTQLRATLASVSTATLTGQLQRRGIRSTFLSGLRPTRPELRLVGVARTLRYVPLREDLQQTLGGGMNAQRRAVEGIGPGEVLVIEARGVPDAGTIGDIFVMRCKALGGAGVITDGALRDTPAITDIDLPVYHQASHAATLGRHHLPLDVNVPVACAGVLVMPGDVLVGDGEGVVVIPAALVEEVARDSARQEDREAFALERVAAGESTVGLFPLSDERRADYDAWRAARRPPG
jgi:regulator of RNase E activity RraA